MKDIYLINFSVKGIKSLDQLVSLSFYKKTITNDPDTRKYNIKGIYGMNGSGKSGIVLAAKILKSLILSTDYLNNPIVQRTLDAIVNKRLNSLFLQAEYMVNLGKKTQVFTYSLLLAKDVTGKFNITSETLTQRKSAAQNAEKQTVIYEVADGELIAYSPEDNFYNKLLKNKTMNLLSTATLCSLFWEKIYMQEKRIDTLEKSNLCFSLFMLFGLGLRLHVFVEESDDHKEFFARDSFASYNDVWEHKSDFEALVKTYARIDRESINSVSVMNNMVSMDMYEKFEKTIERLYQFVHIFKNDLCEIEIDKKEDHEFYICNLVMVYEDYKIYAEFESTGVKKLIELFAYLNEMVNGGIVFIDEFDSNLHDVYLCALLEYLMEYGEGQLCFTTHNVGPMDILKQHKKSIDFLSMDHKIYPWIKSGNYSPANLYRNGMIEGSPFNVDSIDFIGVLDFSEEDL